MSLINKKDLLSKEDYSSFNNIYILNILYN